MSSSPLLFFSLPLIFFLQLAFLMYVIFSFSLSSILLHFFISPDLIPLAPLHFSPYLLPFSFLSVFVLFYFSISSIFSSLIFSFSFPPFLLSFLRTCHILFLQIQSLLTCGQPLSPLPTLLFFPLFSPPLSLSHVSISSPLLSVALSCNRGQHIYHL